VRRRRRCSASSSRRGNGELEAEVERLSIEWQAAGVLAANGTEDGNYLALDLDADSATLRRQMLEWEEVESYITARQFDAAFAEVESLIELRDEQGHDALVEVLRRRGQ
jgi:hypothetical protein